MITILFSLQILIVLVLETYAYEKFLYFQYSTEERPYYFGKAEVFEFQEVDTFHERVADTKLTVYENSDIAGTQAEELYKELSGNLVSMNSLEEFDENFLSMNDFYIDDEIVIDSVVEDCSQPDTVKIKDEQIGVQNWTVSVCGFEQDYIHVSDGSRIWIHVGEKIDCIQNGDVLNITVDRSVDGVKALEIELLQRTNPEYCLPDEPEYFDINHFDDVAAVV